MKHKAITSFPAKFDQIKDVYLWNVVDILVITEIKLNVHFH